MLVATAQHILGLHQRSSR